MVPAWRIPLVLLIVFLCIICRTSSKEKCLKCTCSQTVCGSKANCRQGSVCGQFRASKTRWFEGSPQPGYSNDNLGPEFFRRIETRCTQCECRRGPCAPSLGCRGDICGTLRKYPRRRSPPATIQEGNQSGDRVRCKNCRCTSTGACDTASCQGSLCGFLKQHSAGTQVTPIQLTSSPNVSLICLGCICQAVSNCDMRPVCDANRLCGMFRMSSMYWWEAGALTPRGVPFNQAFEHCASDATCAGATVQNYIAKYAKDCNQDGRIDCYDHLALHVLGSRNCSAPLDQRYFSTFTRCLLEVSKLTSDIDRAL